MNSMVLHVLQMSWMYKMPRKDQHKRLFLLSARMSLSLTAQLLAVSVVSLQRQISHNNNVNRTSIDPSYDYVVVGSGSAGAIVAYRLASNSSLRVLLLEAGPAQTVVSDIPGLAASLVGTEIDWQYKTVPQTNIGQAMVGHRIAQPKGMLVFSKVSWRLTLFCFIGRVIGGTSTM